MPATMRDPRGLYNRVKDAIMPKKIKVANEAHDEWINEEPSVLESTGEKVARTGAKVVSGIADALTPSGGVEDLMRELPGAGLGKSLAAPLVTHYSNPKLRKYGTSLFRESAEGFRRNYDKGTYLGKLIGNTVADDMQELADRFPRVAAHADPFEWIVPGRKTRAQVIPNPPGRKGPVKLEIAEGLVPAIAGPEGKAASKEVVFHEGLHVGQMVGNKDAGQLYTLSNKINRAKGMSESQAYAVNPFEKPAWHRGMKEIGMPYPKPKGALADLRELALESPKNEEHARLQAELRAILIRRGTIGPKDALDYLTKQMPILDRLRKALSSAPPSIKDTYTK